MIIGLAGPIGAGKTAVAARLTSTHNFTRLPFAETLKRMMVEMGVPSKCLTDTILKEEPLSVLCGKSPREAMQTLGTDWGRKMIHRDLWARIWAHKAALAREDLLNIVADDMRFPNEVEAVSDLNGHTIYVSPPGS